MKKLLFLSVLICLLCACEKNVLEREGFEQQNRVLNPNQVVNLLENVLGKSQTEATNILNNAGLDMCDFVGFEGIYITFGKGQTEDEWYRNGVIEIGVEDNTITYATYLHANQKHDICAEEVKALLKIVEPVHTFGASIFTFQEVRYWNDPRVDFWKCYGDNVTTSYVWSDVQGVVNNYNGISVYYKSSHVNSHHDEMILGMSTDDNIFDEGLFGSNGYTCVLEISCF